MKRFQVENLDGTEENNTLLDIDKISNYGNEHVQKLWSPVSIAESGESNSDTYGIENLSKTQMILLIN